MVTKKNVMKLSEQQHIFTANIGLLITWAFSKDYKLTFGEARRTELQAKANAAKGIGISNSLHRISLAVDLNLFIDGVYMQDTPAYKPLGVFWKRLHPDNRWGGDFAKADGNHFSMTRDGVS